VTRSFADVQADELFSSMPRICRLVDARSPEAVREATHGRFTVQNFDGVPMAFVPNMNMEASR
jgi:hypothetical protein